MTNATPKKFTTGRFIKYAGLSILSIIVLVALAAATLLHTLLSPEKVKQIALEQSQLYLNGEISCEKMELSLFSTFPQVGLTLLHGDVVSGMRNATERAENPLPSDTLLCFQKCIITMNPLSYLITNTVNIGKLQIEDASIYAFVDKNGKANWDLVKPEMVVSDSIASEDAATFNSNLHLQRIEIRNSNITFDDRYLKLYTRLEGVNTVLKGYMSDSRNDLDLWLATQNILYWQKGELLARKTAVEIDTRISSNRKTGHSRLEDTRLTVNGITINGSGELQRYPATTAIPGSEHNSSDSISGEALVMDLRFGLDIPSLDTAFKLIPKSIVREAANVTAEGKINVSGTLQGQYGRGKMPVLTAQAAIENGKASYRGMSQKIDTLNLEMITRLDFGSKENSFVELKEFCFVGASSHLDFKGVITDPLENPQVSAELHADIDFGELARIFPVQDSLTLGGKAKSNIHGDFALSDIRNRNWGKLDIRGEALLSKVNIVSTADSFEFITPQAKLIFGSVRSEQANRKRNLLSADIAMERFRFLYKNDLLTLRDLKWDVRTMPAKDTLEIIPLISSLKFTSLWGRYEDSIRIRTADANISIRMMPQRENKHLPRMSAKLQFDSLFVRSGGNMLSMAHSDFNVKGSKRDTVSDYWNSDGSVDFVNLKLFSPSFPLVIAMPSSKVIVGDDKLTLDHARLKAGSSEMTLTGSFRNLTAALLHNGVLQGELHLTSDNIDCNELMKAFEQGSRHAEQGDSTLTANAADESVFDEIPQPRRMSRGIEEEESSSGVFVVPPYLDLVLDTDIRNAYFAKLYIERIKGKMAITQQRIELSNLEMHTMAADMSTSILYHAPDSTGAYTGMEIDMKDILVGRLVEFIPALDTLMPMLGSLDGKVNFTMAAEMRLDSTMSVIIPSIHAASKIKGDSLVLLDGETFAEISKMLRFKNKQRNLIDSMSVDLTIDQGQIEIYPFVVNFDRYQAAVGGKHNLDMSFNYHISVLKSPVPFTLGLNVTGNPDDFKYKLVRPKYKNLKKSAYKSPVDSTAFELKRKLREALHQGALGLDSLTVPAVLISELPEE